MSNPTTPPAGDALKAESYLAKVIDLINQDKLTVWHTNLEKFDPSNLEDHYRLELKDYSVEISHSKQPNSGADSFIMLFTNLKYVSEGCSEKIILAYLHLTSDQFHRFKQVAQTQTDRIKKIHDEQRFKSAMDPIDKALEDVSNTPEGAALNDHQTEDHQIESHQHQEEPKSEVDYTASSNSTQVATT